MNWPNRLSLLRVGLVPLIVLMIIIGASWSYGVALALFLVGGRPRVKQPVTPLPMQCWKSRVIQSSVRNGGCR